MNSKETLLIDWCKESRFFGICGGFKLTQIECFSYSKFKNTVVVVNTHWKNDKNTYQYICKNFCCFKLKNFCIRILLLSLKGAPQISSKSRWRKVHIYKRIVLWLSSCKMKQVSDQSLTHYLILKGQSHEIKVCFFWS